MKDKYLVAAAAAGFALLPNDIRRTISKAINYTVTAKRAIKLVDSGINKLTSLMAA